ncbi:23S rRNA (adenine(2030)-N(6))-methyltransferase RlmJ [Roseiarcaceae bacterium H3SJ34-1]|uniref:23S rRNA (adenine(2030)-N(6))-methyltransferase RlmJ n=1 Tax=Terripilifer ovatus TaxID=3032367 RepID=UPI003AB9ADB8|nr:23S rRNA (adenine(2030)-N(6))-methyltransferase RlmJ [Roseiarcaceae bacterium H3SJ34-1]
MARILVYLVRKDAPLRYLDTHAGIGRYDLRSEQAQKTGEWHDGIARIAKAKIPASIEVLLKPWLDALGPLDETGRPASYPGSPMLAQHLLRAQDRLTLCDLHDQDVRVLGRNMGKDPRVKVIRIDGYMALKAYVPPIERRGLVLVDPPFESPDEFVRLRDSVIAAWRKWPTGTYVLWYPVKDIAAVEDLHDGLAAAGISRILRAEIDVGLTDAAGKLSASGLAIINPPYPLFDEIKMLAPWLAQTLAQGAAPRWTCAWTAGEV